MKNEIIKEFSEHIPFTAMGSIIAVLLSIYLYQFNISGNAFEILHPIHIIASAIVTAGLYNKYTKKALPAILIGLTGSIIIGSLSDIIFPYLGSNILGLTTSFHLPLIEEPLVIISSSLIGSLIGLNSLKMKLTHFSHFVHVAISIFASMFYIMTFSSSLTFNVPYFISAFAIVFIAVLIPCCLSDLVYPLLFVRKKK